MSEMVYREIINDMVWSYSRVSCFEECPYRWFLKYIRKEKEVPQFYSSYGSFIHKLIEKYYKSQLTKAEMLTYYVTNFSKEVEGHRPNDTILGNYIKCGFDYLNSFKEFPYNMVSVEEKMDFEINGTKFVGYIDYLGEKDGEYYIVDNKSRKLKPRSNRKKPTKKDRELDMMLTQLYLYAYAVKQKYGKYPKALCFNCFRNNTFIEEPFDESKCKEAIEQIMDGIESIKQTNDFYPNMEFFSCLYMCGFNDDCCYWQGR